MDHSGILLLKAIGEIQKWVKELNQTGWKSSGPYVNWWIHKADPLIRSVNHFLFFLNQYNNHQISQQNKNQDLHVVTVKSIERKTLFKNQQAGGGGLVLQPNQSDLARVTELKQQFMKDWVVLFSGACICKPLQLTSMRQTQGEGDMVWVSIQ